MWRNYFLVAIRNLKRHRFFSFINVFGLAISMSVCLGIIMLVADQLMYDRHNTKRDRIFRVNTRYLNSDGSPAGNDYATAPAPLAETLVRDYTGVEKAVRIRRGFGNPWIELEQDVNIPLAGFYADPDAFDVFEYTLKYGDVQTALREPYSVVLTEKAAKKLFKQENPLGEVIKVGNLGEYKVTGVIAENADHKSHIVFEALASYSTLKSLESAGIVETSTHEWGDWTSGWVYVLLEEGRSANDIEGHLAAISKKEQPEKHSAEDNRRYKFYLQNLSSVTPGPFINNPIGPFMPRIFVYFFGGLALIVMLTSCFNYTNLSIARALTRAREIGVRKVNGAYRYQIFLQFLTESVLFSFLALGLALLMLVAVKPFLLNLKFAQVLKWDMETNIYVYLAFIGFSLIAGIVAGLFPSIILSKFQPVKVLKNAGSIKLLNRMGLRKSLLVGQFTLSLVFILSVVVLYNQLQLFIKADYGFDISSKISIKLNQTNWEPLKNELMLQSNIVNVAPSSHIPAAGTSYGDGFKINLQEGESVPMSYFYVDANYLESLSLKLIAGKNFEPQSGETSKTLMLINEEAVRKFQFASAADAVGAYIYCERDSMKFQVIGVVKDYNHEVLIEKIGPMALRYDPAQFNLLQVKYAGSYEEASKSVEMAWAKVNPTQKLDYKSFEEEISFFYRTVFADFVSVIGVISVMAILISCLGLLGMATYATETRLKEISIRKVLGSSSEALVFLISKSFLKLLAVAIVIAVPLAWFINSMWLEVIAYRTEFSLAVVATGVGIVVILGILTIGSQTVRAAFSNPVDSLKNE
jgi:putative ABC transport system permease protein